MEVPGFISREGSPEHLRFDSSTLRQLYAAKDTLPPGGLSNPGSTGGDFRGCYMAKSDDRSGMKKLDEKRVKDITGYFREQMARDMDRRISKVAAALANPTRNVSSREILAMLKAPKVYPHKTFYFDPVVDEAVKKALASNDRANELASAGVQGWNDLGRKLFKDWVEGKIRLTPAK